MMSTQWQLKHSYTPAWRRCSLPKRTGTHVLPVSHTHTQKKKKENLRKTKKWYIFLSFSYCYFSSLSPIFLLLCTPDYCALRSEWTINCLIIPVTPSHNEIFIQCLQQSLAETVLLFLNQEELLPLAPLSISCPGFSAGCQ